MLSAILGIFIVSLVAPIVARRLSHLGGWVPATAPAALTPWFASFMMSVSTAKFATNPR